MGGKPCAICPEERLTICSSCLGTWLPICRENAGDERNETGC